MVCTTCGRASEMNAQFCSGCGQPLVVYTQRPVPMTRLVRPRESRMIAGVCAGFALQYGWDLTVVRLVLVIAALFTGVPLIAYLIAWVVMPNAQYALPAQASVPPGVPPGMPPGSGPGSIVS